MKALHAISGIWEHTGGPAESVPRLCSSLVKLGNKITILTLEGPLSIAALESKSDGVEIITLPHYRQMSLGVFKASLDLVQNYDIVHGHGLWLPLNWAAGNAAIKNGKPLLITTRGALNPNALNHSRYKKRIFGALLDNRYLRAARCIHVTSHDEYLAIRQYGLKNPVAIIPNGVHQDIVKHIPSDDAFRSKHGIPPEVKILLFLSRISWEKGLEDLAVAWQKIAAAFSDWQLVIVGPGKPEYVAKLKNTFDSIVGGKKVLWLGPLEGGDKFAAYASASLFVLPSHTENFSLVTIEALAAGVPVVTTHGTPWSELPKNGCGWWVPVGAEGITVALREAMIMPEEKLKEMGLRGNDLIGEKYTWPVIARQVSEVYGWMLGRCEMPSCVITD